MPDSYSAEQQARMALNHLNNGIVAILAKIPFETGMSTERIETKRDKKGYLWRGRIGPEEFEILVTRMNLLDGGEEG